jgi:antitoxin FitA
MLFTCDSVHRMGMIQIRNVPEDLHRALKVRAAQQGFSLSDYLLREIERVASRPTLDEVFAAIRSDGTVRPRRRSADAVRAERSGR